MGWMCWNADIERCTISIHHRLLLLVIIYYFFCRMQLCWHWVLLFESVFAKQTHTHIHEPSKWHVILSQLRSAKDARTKQIFCFRQRKEMLRVLWHREHPWMETFAYDKGLTSRLNTHSLNFTVVRFSQRYKDERKILFVLILSSGEGFLEADAGYFHWLN